MSIERKANQVLEQATKLAEKIKSWADYSNSLFDQTSGIVAKAFPDTMERQAFYDSEQYKKVLEIQTVLMRKFGLVAGASPKEKSGKFVVRLARTMHQKLDIEAKREGVSLNQLAVTKLSLPLPRATGVHHDAIVEAFNSTHDGYSQDLVVLEPRLNQLYLKRCRELGLQKYTDLELNHRLLNLRKTGKGQLNRSTRRRRFNNYDDCAFASEIAVRILQRTESVTLDRIICDPVLRDRFDSIAGNLAPVDPMKLRCAALYLRKSRRLRPIGIIPDQYDLTSAGPIKSVVLSEIERPKIENSPGTYVFYDQTRPLFAGETDDLNHRIERHLKGGLPEWLEIIRDGVILKYSVWNASREERTHWLDAFINKERPLLNYQNAA